MEDKAFYCKVVGMSITTDVCVTRIRQAKEFNAKGEPHASLNKCIICKGLEFAEPTKPPASSVLDVAEEFCPHCERPRVHKKLRWSIKHGAHVNCYYNLNKKSSGPEVKVTRPAISTKVTPLEDPERIIQCSASPSWARCHDCYAVKNCAIYEGCLRFSDTKDCAIRNAPGGTVSTLEQPPARAVPDTSEQDHYTACKIQPIEFIVANNLDFLEGNIVKYVARYKRKDGLKDLAKARHYLAMLIEREEGRSDGE